MPFAKNSERIASAGERTGSTLQVYETLKTSPISTVPKTFETTGLTMPTVNGALEELLKLGIVEEVTGTHRSRIFGYGE